MSEHTLDPLITNSPVSHDSADQFSSLSRLDSDEQTAQATSRGAAATPAESLDTQRSPDSNSEPDTESRINSARHTDTDTVS